MSTYVVRISIYIKMLFADHDLQVTILRFYENTKYQKELQSIYDLRYTIYGSQDVRVVNYYKLRITNINYDLYSVVGMFR